jgi:hypothetical protein
MENNMETPQKIKDRITTTETVGVPPHPVPILLFVVVVFGGTGI